MLRLTRAIGWLRSIVRVARRYRQSHRRWPNLIYPKLYSEKMQWRKLFDFNPEYTTLSDKFGVRAFIKERAGDELLTKCLWYGSAASEMPLETLTPPYFVKSAHGSLQVKFVENGLDPEERSQIRAEADSWLATNHGDQATEPGYTFVPAGIIIEEPIRNKDGSPPLEIKAYVFGGRIASFLAIEVDQGTLARRRCHLTVDWSDTGWTIKGEPAMYATPGRPKRLPELIRIIEAIAAGFDHLRVDTYYSDDRIFVGEVTVYSQSGLAVFSPPEADQVLGSVWEGDFSPVLAMRIMLSGSRERLMTDAACEPARKNGSG